MCALEGHEERIKSIDSDLQGIRLDMLLIDDYESLTGRACLEEDLFKVVGARIRATN